MKVIYLIQGDNSHPPYDIPASSEFLYLQWQRDFVARENHFHFPNSTWAQGRNELYRRAKDKGDYDYYVFMDDDIIFRGPTTLKELCNLPFWRQQRMWYKNFFFAPSYMYVKARNYRAQWNLQIFESMLVRCNAAVAVPFLFNHPWCVITSPRDVDCILYGDQAFVAVSKDAAKYLLPYETRFDDVSWWLCGEVFFELASKMYTGKVLRFNYLPFLETASRDYPRFNETWRMPQNEVHALKQKQTSV